MGVQVKVAVCETVFFLFVILLFSLCSFILFRHSANHLCLPRSKESGESCGTKNEVFVIASKTHRKLNSCTEVMRKSSVQFVSSN